MCAGEGSFVRVVLSFLSLHFAPPRSTSTDTAYTTNCLARSDEAKRALWAFSKADSFSQRAGSTTAACSVQA